MGYLMYQRRYMGLLFYDLNTFQIFGQKFVKFFGGFLENLRNQNDILKLSDLQKAKMTIIDGQKWQIPAIVASSNGLDKCVEGSKWPFFRQPGHIEQAFPFKNGQNHKIIMTLLKLQSISTYILGILSHQVLCNGGPS